MNVLKENESFIKDISKLNKKAWVNPFYLPFELTNGLCSLIIPDSEIEEAKDRFLKFAPFIKKAFPETADSDGIIESPLREIPLMKKALEDIFKVDIPGNLYLKMDSHLKVAGSIKARGGIYEVLKHAEDLAITHGMINPTDNYEKFLEEDMKKFFSDYTIQVGSTGNLGMSIGIMSAALGFKVIIHMSHDAKQWKKDLLRSKGVTVLEYNDDYSYAVKQGRENSKNDNFSYFVDDEYSKDLFLGYAVAALRLKKQLEENNVTVDENHPLIVYLPAGVGGAPGGICYGLKRIFKDNVHCFFIEPALYPSVTLGIATTKHEKVNVSDYGIKGKTEADGLACPSPSGYVTRIVSNLVSGSFIFEDDVLYDYLRMLYDKENIKIEPSACAGFEGAVNLNNYSIMKEYMDMHGITNYALNNSTQIVWATGGMLVPESIFDEYLNTYKND